MDNKQIFGYLEELLRFRQHEFRQMTAARCSQKLLQSYASRTAAVEEAAKQLEAQPLEETTEQTCRELTLDEAIQHCKDIASRSCDSCAKQHLQLADWLEELKQKKDCEAKMKQLAADWDNARKRMAREREEVIASANSKLLAQLLDVADNLQLAAASFSRKDRAEDVGKGLELVHQQLQQVLSSNGCKKIECNVGDKFDVSKHEAMSAQKAVDEPPDTVLLVAKDGYMLNGKLLRPAKVVVSA